MSEEALATALFMEKVNDMFDKINGTSPNAPESKAAVTSTNMLTKIANMRLNADWVSQWRFFNRMTKKESHRHTFPKGWQVALRAMALLSTQLIGIGFPFVPLRRN